MGLNNDWLSRMNAMVDYIEEHLDDEIDERELSRITAVPVGLLLRMMPVVANTTLADYIRRRRLTRAGMELVTSNVKIIDLAVKYGYESSAAFAAAFKRQHGVAPSEARLNDTRSDVRLKSSPRLAFTLSVRGEEEMETRIIQREAFNVAGKAIAVTQDTKDEITRFWDRCNGDGSEQQLLKHGKPPFLGVCYSMDDSGGFRYMIGLETDAQTAPDGLELVTVPKSTWAAFDCTGSMPDAMQKVWARIFTEFLPSDVYAHAGTPDLEVYSPGDNSAKDYHSEVWIPIVKKNNLQPLRGGSAR